MQLKDCWITYALYYATGEGMHYAIAVAGSADRAKGLFDASASQLYRGESTTAPLSETVEHWQGLRDAIPPEVLRRADDPLCWTLEYVATINFNCA